jgi:hypothetical protein
MDVKAVTRAIAWLQTHIFSHVFFLMDSMSVIRKFDIRKITRKCLETIERSIITSVCFIFVPSHTGVNDNVTVRQLIVVHGGIYEPYRHS